MDLQTLPLPSSPTIGSSLARSTRAHVTTVLRGTRVRRLIFFAGLLVLWEAVSRFGPWPDYLMPGPVAVGRAIVAGLRSGLFVQGAVISMARLLTGYGISLVGGILIGTLLVRFTLLRETVGSLIVGL